MRQLDYTIDCLQHGRRSESGARYVQDMRDVLASLIGAAEGIESNWERGDLADAANILAGMADDARTLLERTAW